jgi:carbamoylphosphate synthase large subunit
MLAALNYEGVACIDLRRDRKDGKLYLLEINARFWGSVMASYRLANVNFPLFMLKLSFGESVPDYKKTEGRQMALGTFSNEYFRFKFPDLEMLKFWPYFNDPIARFQYFWRKRF